MSLSGSLFGALVGLCRLISLNGEAVFPNGVPLVMVVFCLQHYENTSMYNVIIHCENFKKKSFDIFLIFAQNIDCGYTLESPRRGDSNEYPQSMLWSKNKKNTPAYTSLVCKSVFFSFFSFFFFFFFFESQKSKRTMMR